MVLLLDEIEIKEVFLRFLYEFMNMSLSLSVFKRNNQLINLHDYTHTDPHADLHF